MCRILKIRQNTASHSASAEYSAKLPNIRLRQPAEDYSVHPYILEYRYWRLEIFEDCQLILKLYYLAIYLIEKYW